MEDKIITVSYRFHGCWWLGNVRGQVIIRHAIDLNCHFPLIYIYIYIWFVETIIVLHIYVIHTHIYMCVCVCVCVAFSSPYPYIMRSLIHRMFKSGCFLAGIMLSANQMPGLKIRVVSVSRVLDLNQLANSYHSCTYKIWGTNVIFL